MDNQQTIPLKQQAATSPEQDLFRYYARPLTSKLLETMELSKHFFSWRR